MKGLKKLTSLMLAIALVLSISVPSFAAQNTNSLTVKNTGKADHTFELYQIFTGDVVKGKKSISNIKWGNGVTNPTGSAEEAAKKMTDEKAALDLVKALTLNNSNATKSEAVKPQQSHKFTGLKAGYYLVKDVDKSQNKDKLEDGAYTLYILKVVGEVEAETKLDVPKVEKKVKDINDSESQTEGEWADTADHDIGDKVSFKLEGTLPTNFDKYTTYKYVFHDELSEGLTFEENTVVVKVDGTTITNGFTKTKTANGFDITFDDLKKVSPAVNHTSKITVEYKATLNQKAKLGSAGNPNEVYLEYSNNPNKGGEGDTGKTPKDKVIVFTYKVVVNKVDGNAGANKPLSGAQFKLEKWDAKTNAYKDAAAAVTGTGGTSFEFKGLDDGKYRLTETVTPDGYNTINPIEFNVVAKHKDDNLTLESLNGEALTGSIDLNFTPKLQEGALETTVVNKSGPELPETGGMGRTILYVVGAALIIGAGAILLSNRKKAGK